MYIFEDVVCCFVEVYYIIQAKTFNLKYIHWNKIWIHNDNSRVETPIVQLMRRLIIKNSAQRGGCVIKQSGQTNRNTCHTCQYNIFSSYILLSVISLQWWAAAVTGQWILVTLLLLGFMSSQIFSLCEGDQVSAGPFYLDQTAPE